MAWIRLSDDYCDHPKFDNLSDGAFRLWHQAMGFCRKYQTDGLVPLASLRKFKAYSPKRVNELSEPWTKDARALWEPLPGFGVKVYNYLKWNPSKDEEGERRTDSKDRMRQLREERRQNVGVAPPPVSTNILLTPSAHSDECSHDVLGLGGEGLVIRSLKEEESASTLARTFDEFWRIYPRKVGKDAAWRAWQKRKPNQETSQVVFAALAWQKQQDDWLREAGRYVPYPATWINQGRWQDEPSETPQFSDTTLAVTRATQEFLRS